MLVNLKEIVKKSNNNLDLLRINLAEAIEERKLAIANCFTHQVFSIFHLDKICSIEQFDWVLACVYHFSVNVTAVFFISTLFGCNFIPDIFCSFGWDNASAALMLEASIQKLSVGVDFVTQKQGVFLQFLQNMVCSFENRFVAVVSKFGMHLANFHSPVEVDADTFLS